MDRDFMPQTAIARKIGFGMRDTNRPVLWFDADMNGAGALIVIEVDEALRIIKELHLRDIRDLEGLPLTVQTDGTIVRYEAFWRRP